MLSGLECLEKCGKRKINLLKNIMQLKKYINLCNNYFLCRILDKNGLATTMNERNLLTKLSFHLIPGLISAFQSELNLYIVLPLMERGDLRYHITKFKYFP